MKMSKKNSRFIKNSQIGEGTRVYFPVNIYDAFIGKNCLIGAFVEIGGASICNNCKIHPFSFICKYVKIEDYVFISQGVMFTNSKYPAIPSQWHDEVERGTVSTFVRKGVSIGANSTIIPGVTIGENTVIGAGSVVTKSIPANVVAFGNPCEVKRKK